MPPPTEDHPASLGVPVPPVDWSAGRPRRRAVGPAGAAPSVGVDRVALDLEPAGDELPPVDDDERLRRDVPPHHGG